MATVESRLPLIAYDAVAGCVLTTGKREATKTQQEPTDIVDEPAAMPTYEPVG